MPHNQQPRQIASSAEGVNAMRCQNFLPRMIGFIAVPLILAGCGQQAIPAPQPVTAIFTPVSPTLVATLAKPALSPTPTTALPIATPTQPSAFFEDFERDLGGQIDLARWNVGGSDTQLTVLQKDGRLRLSGSAGKMDQWDGTGLAPKQYIGLPLTKFGVVEAKLMLASDHKGGPAQIGLIIREEVGGPQRKVICFITEISREDV